MSPLCVILAIAHAAMAVHRFFSGADPFLVLADASAATGWGIAA